MPHRLGRRLVLLFQGVGRALAERLVHRGKWRDNFGHTAFRPRRKGALALDLDHNRLGAPVTKALPNLPGLDGLLELKPAWPVQLQRFFLFARRHITQALTPWDRCFHCR
jgi:hypothetical protein